MPKENPTTETNVKPAQREAPSLIQIAFPQQANLVFIAAMIIGLLLISISLISLPYFVLNGMQSNLLLASGVGIILAAFGGQATVRTGFIWLAGAAAVAYLLFHTMHKEKLFLKGSILGFNNSNYESVVIKLNEKDVLLGSMNVNNPNNWYYDFVIFMNEIDNYDYIKIQIVEKGSKKEKLLQVPKNEFLSYFGRDKEIRWVIGEKIKDNSTILKLCDHNDNEITNEDKYEFSGKKFLMNQTWIKPAIAQESSVINIPQMLGLLKADDATTRRSARVALSQAPIDSIPMIMGKLQQEGSNYQVKLGICVALTEMLRADKNRGPQISSKLTEDDLNKMIDAAGDSDRTVRIYATEFLFDLGDKRATKLAISRAAKTSDENARYNWLLLSQDGWRKLTKAEKEELAVPLQEAWEHSGDKTRRLFDKLKI